MSGRSIDTAIIRGAIVLLVVACLAVATQPGTFTRTLNVSGPVSLDVSSEPGGVEITTGPASTVRIHATIKPLYGRFDFDVAEANIRALEKNPPIEQQGGTIRVGYVNDPALLRGVTIHFEIETPRTTQVRVSTNSGGIRINGIQGPADARTASGRTEITNVASDIKVTGRSGGVVIRKAGHQVDVRTQSGSIELSNIQGSVQAETTSGRTEIGDVSGEIRSTTNSGIISINGTKGAVVARNGSGRIDALHVGGSVHAQTNSGAIRISQVNPASIRARAESGAIHVTLAGDAGYNIDAQSKSGKIHGPAGTTSQKRADMHTLKAQIGPGGPLVDLDTRSSKIEIR